MGDMSLGDGWVERELFFFGMCTEEPTTPWLPLNIVIWWPLVVEFFQPVWFMLLSQAIQPCYIFLHSFPPVLSFTVSKEQESLANTQSKVVPGPDRTVISKKLPDASLFQWTSDFLYRKRRETTWRRMWHPHLFSFCYFFSTPIFWMVSERLSCSLIRILRYFQKGWRVHHSALVMRNENVHAICCYSFICKIFGIKIDSKFNTNELMQLIQKLVLVFWLSSWFWECSETVLITSSLWVSIFFQIEGVMFPAPQMKYSSENC